MIHYLLYTLYIYIYEYYHIDGKLQTWEPSLSIEVSGGSRGCSGGPLMLPHKAIGAALATTVPLVESVGAKELCLKAQLTSPI